MNKNDGPEQDELHPEGLEEQGVEEVHFQDSGQFGYCQRQRLRVYECGSDGAAIAKVSSR